MKKNRAIAFLAVVCMLSVAVMVTALCRGGGREEFVPPAFDPAAISGTPEAPGYQELDVQAFRVGLCGPVHVRDGAAEVWFSNPEGNGVWLKLRVLDEAGRILGQSGLLRPGEYVRWVSQEGAEPGMTVTLKVMAYEPDTYHSAGSMSFQTGLASE